MKIQKILTTIDIDGEINQPVISYSVGLAKVFDAKLMFLHTYEIPYPYPVGGAGGWAGYPAVPAEQDNELIKEVAREKQNQFERLVEKIPQMNSIRYEYLSHVGNVADVIDDQAETLGIDLIIMGTSDAIGINVFWGTAAEKVTRKSPCPVVVIPRDFAIRPMKKVCLAVDPERTIKEDDISILLQIVKAYNTGLDIVHVHTDNDIQIDESKIEFLEHLKEQMDENAISYCFHTISSENVEQGITEFTDLNQIDILGLVYRDHGFFKRMFNPGVRKKLVSESEIPLLILK